MLHLTLPLWPFGNYHLFLLTDRPWRGGRDAIRRLFSILTSDRTADQVTLEWRPSPCSNGLTVIGYKLFVNNRLLAILSHDQLTYTLTNGSPCDEYTVHIQALSHDKNISSPLSRGVEFTWPGIKPGAFRRLDDGKTGTVIVAWDHPRLEDETDRLVGFRVLTISKGVLQNEQQLSFSHSLYHRTSQHTPFVCMANTTLIHTKQQSTI